MSKFSQILLVIILLLGGVVFIQFKHASKLSDERDRYKQNNTALLSDIERIKVDSTTMAVDAKALRLTIDEYERFRAADAEKIRQMGIKIKNLQAVAKHNLEVAAPINAVIRDTVFIRDTVHVVQQKVEMASPHIQLDAVKDNDTLRGDIRLPVTLQQTVWVEYKRKCLFWKKVKAIHQTISSDSPYVDIKYSEYMQIDKK
ncbi:MAG: hypothetical protein IKU22_01765 [Alistipes sp.]|nr:hypothetical protein [Alistipes sp.]